MVIAKLVVNRNYFCVWIADSRKDEIFAGVNFRMAMFDMVEHRVFPQYFLTAVILDKLFGNCRTTRVGRLNKNILRLMADDHMKLLFALPNKSLQHKGGSPADIFAPSLLVT